MSVVPIFRLLFLLLNFLQVMIFLFLFTDDLVCCTDYAASVDSVSFVTL